MRPPDLIPGRHDLREGLAHPPRAAPAPSLRSPSPPAPAAQKTCPRKAPMSIPPACPPWDEISAPPSCPEVAMFIPPACPPYPRNSAPASTAQNIAMPLSPLCHPPLRRRTPWHHCSPKRSSITCTLLRDVQVVEPHECRSGSMIHPRIRARLQLRWPRRWSFRICVPPLGQG